MRPNLFRTVIKKINGLKTNYSKKLFAEHNKKAFSKPKRLNKKRQIVLVEFNSMNSSHIAYSYLSQVLAAEHNARIIAYTQKTLKSFIERLLFSSNKIICQNNFKIYQSFGTDDVIAISLSRVQKEKAIKIHKAILPAIVTKRDLEELKIDGVWVGDLFYDSYLMDYKRPTFTKDSPEFHAALLDSIGLFVFWQEFFTSNNVCAVIVSHCVYNLAIPLRIAVWQGVAAYQANIHHIYRLDAKNLFAYNDFFSFRKIFARLPGKMQVKGIETARERIRRRFSGEVGIDMIYSSKSAFGSPCRKRLLKKSSRKKILIATHCFFDSPHSYGNNIFPDFYEWLDFLGKMSEETDYDWYIKTHPDYLPGTMEIIKSFVARYPKLTLLPSDSSHHQLIAEGIDVALTVYGTIAFEYAALGIPVINASQNNPHVAYDFNLHAKDVEDYRRLIHGVQEMNFSIEVSSVYEYYFMKNLFFSWDIFFKSFDSTVSGLGGYNNLFTTLVYDRWLQEWNQEAHEVIMDRLTSFVRSNTFRFAPRELKYLLPKTNIQ